ncbi:hypothetical protein PPERSA_07820 [Pseudocohnilembus persalinus]|uniref:Papain family cysteine protease n=1 Tax=Pseudocohnilembus persalinus TaxID=266149 RepID=A0A0V0QC89_PSEPJ|nr:hypothetical protein PPERSA_07820 [Pseudocohnilembus persalinus]|eukprot:KRW99743.1 hypothetical protein PPERSA_07820 [Pseudocohnilembus persalinus]
MKTAAILLALLALAGTTLFFQENQTSDEAVAFTKYSEWKSKFNKAFNTEEDAYRFLVFLENYLFVKEFNAKNNFELGVHNEFAAMTNDEFRATFTSEFIRENQPKNAKTVVQSTAAPSGSIDWVSKGAVLPIQNQGQCGSCWAFSAVSSLEGLYFLNNGKLVDFSEQQVVSCEPISYGCNGGWPEAAFSYVAKKGLEEQSTYPYEQLNNSRTQPCNYNADKAIQGVNTGYGNVAANNPNAMLEQLEKQPISILVSAGNIVFQLYSGGIIDSSACGTNLDHAINIVAYKDGVWTARNSWGTTWGEQGYARIQWSEGAGYCGINSSPSYPK